MQRVDLNAEERKDFKKGAAGRLRRMGKIPAIVYGHREPKAVSIDEVEFNRKFHTVSENVLINLKTDDETYDVLVKNYQEDILADRIMHIDFYEIEKGKLLRTHVPVHIEGTSPAVKEGGILDHRLQELEVECMPQDIPEVFTVDVSNLESGDAIHVSDIEVPDGVKIMNNEDQVIVGITHAKVELVEEEEELEEEEMLEEGEEAAAEEEEETEEEEA